MNRDLLHIKIGYKMGLDEILGTDFGDTLSEIDL